MEEKEPVFIGFEKVPFKSEKQEKQKKIKTIVITIVLCILCLAIGLSIGYFFGYDIHPVNKADQANTFGEIEAMLDNYWIYSDDYDDLKTTLEDKAFYGMTSFEDDPYTTYMSQDELKEFANSINMDYVGIGVVYSLNNDCAIIQRVIIDSPAEHAGLQVGDIIEKVDGVSIEGLTTTEIKEKVIGEEGSEVVITVLRANEHLDITVIRGSVDNSVYCFAENDYVVMQLESFGSNTAKDCMFYLDDFTDYHKIIIDLRDNTGGYQTSVKEIAGLFIGNGKVYLRQKDAKGNEEADYTECRRTYDNFDNIVILINGQTASAAEVFAICLKEQLPYVTLVGETSYGKGVIQTTHYLLNGGVLKYTSYYWYSPNGVSINKVGITPDIEVKQADIYYEYYKQMPEDSVYEYDCVSEIVEICEKGLAYLDYDVERQDGYFDKSFETALIKYQNDRNLDGNGVLDESTYNTIMSDVIVKLSDSENDVQYQRAIELISK